MDNSVGDASHMHKGNEDGADSDSVEVNQDYV